MPTTCRPRRQRTALVVILGRSFAEWLQRKGSGAEAVAMMAEAVRWRRYGKDRLYVTAADGTKLGYRDLLTHEDHLEAADRGVEFTVIVTTWLAGESARPVVTVESAAAFDVAVPEQPKGHELIVDSVASDAADPVAEPEVVEEAVPVEAAWEDLAQRRAGAMAREEALALKEAAPVRAFVARMLGIHTDERAWRIGADGEEKVAAQLAKLARKDPRWQSLHAIPVGKNGSDIDHLVVGPGGVFSLNAKHHPGAKVWVGGNRLMINGQRQPYIRNSRYEAGRAARLLTDACGFAVFVTGVVVPVDADQITIKTSPADVHVVNRMRLVRWLQERPVVLADMQIEAIFAAARRSTTWQPLR